MKTLDRIENNSWQSLLMEIFFCLTVHISFNGCSCYYGRTSLAFACCTNQWSMAEILLKYGASMNTVNTEEKTVILGR